MSKGGAGKVYFVLYLAVILELLIIIVERDEAEEHLIKKQKESMRIVESILSQLQVGAGTEGITTRPQDQITIPPPNVNIKELMGGVDIKAERKYLVEVGITDVSSNLKTVEGEEPEEYIGRLKRFLRLSNVTDLKYQILYSSNKEESVPMDPAEWALKDSSQLKLNYKKMEDKIDERYSSLSTTPKVFVDSVQQILLDATYDPAPETSFKPRNVKEPEYYYSRPETETLGAEASRKKRTFVVNFEPRDAGWYKLKFSSQTNKILGVSVKEGQGYDIDPEEKVNIGTVQLKVKDLIKVREELLKTTDGLPSAELVRTSLEDFEQKLAALSDSTEELPAKARIRLYGAIVKLTTPGIKAETAFRQNQGEIEFNIRVLKPTPQITDPKIADIETTVRVFDKLSKLVLPMQVTPANGQTEFEKNPGQASIGGSGATVSSSDGATKWVSKTLEIPVAGNLAPREEPYVFEIYQRNQSKRSELVQCSVYVYPSRITNEDEIKSVLEASWGDNIEIVATPSSGNTIKPNEFIMQFNMGGGSQIAPVRKLAVQQSDNIVVPPGTDKVQLTIGWRDPRSNETVELFSGTGEVGLKKPVIITTDMRSEPIVDNMSGEFKVVGIVIRPPSISETERADVGEVNVSVNSATVRDMKTGQTYKAIVVGKPKKISGMNYEVVLKLQGAKFPLTRGQVKGNVAITISASARSQGTESRPRQLTKTVSVSN